MYHYVYILEDEKTKEFYIGSRSCNCLPEEDSYMGSMSVWKPNKENLIKTIIKSDFETRDEAIEYESKLIQEYINDELNRNYHIPDKGFHTVGLFPVKDSEGNYLLITKDDPKYLSGELISVNKDSVTVKDSEGNCFRVSVNDPKYLSGELKHNLIGTVKVKDFEGNILTVDKNDTKYLSGELVGITKDSVTVKDTKGNIFRVSKDDKRYLSGELVGHTKGYKHSKETKQKISKSLSGKGSGESNSQYGTCWIYNLDLKESKKINKNDLDLWLNQGWQKGRKLKF